MSAASILLCRLPRRAALISTSRLFRPATQSLKTQAVTRRTPIENERREVLEATLGEQYPLLTWDSGRDGVLMTNKNFLKTFAHLKVDEKFKDQKVTIRGRIRSYRDLSKRLLFLDILRDQYKVQCVASFGIVGGERAVFAKTTSALRVGDIISITGFPGRSSTGELSIYATAPPKLLAPCLHQLPDQLKNPEKLIQHRHLDLLINPVAVQTLKLRARIIQGIRRFFTSQNFIEVQTPILSYSAGGALATPFLTAASSTHRPLALRIAPELWLKRLIVGGLDRVFELGPQFRNEGIDATHNPEFTTCELYQSFGRLHDIMSLTEQLFQDIEVLTRQLREPDGICNLLPPLDPDHKGQIHGPWRRIQFIPALEECIGLPLPNLDEAEEIVTPALRAFCASITPPLELAHDDSTSAKILDRLASVYLEPQCQGPTWIMYHPECMSALAKGTTRLGRRVSNRCELFVGGKELVNAYEEENDPEMQRLKFRLQARAERGCGNIVDATAAQGEEEEEEVVVVCPSTRGEVCPSTQGGVCPTKVKSKDWAAEEVIDESYCSTLEWGMPPTAGWGLGVDRMIMYFSGQDRISDVLAFGGLRGAVNQGAVKPMKKAENMQKGKKENVVIEGKEEQKAVEKEESLEAGEKKEEK